LTTLNQTGGLIYSQRLLLALIDKGAIRKEAYEHVQQHAMAACKGEGAFQDLIEQDSFIAKYLTAKEIALCFDPKTYLRHTEEIYTRVFGRKVQQKRPVHSRFIISRNSFSKRKPS
jgi:adenylosuccinate lyase